ncbi:MAG: TIM barrel protein [Nanoarchaeota archaeon]|nr:TIM barrel protein [Nanoarchaeota archaeon]MBU1029762.1 TIM barrel protein [Nanoarchaeota archaeon]
MNNKLLFGTAGIPISTLVYSTINGVETVRSLGLDCMELEFVRGVNISSDKAPLIKSVAEKNNVILTSHCPYFINLNALEEQKVFASIKRILDSANITRLCGGVSTVFHAGYYLKMEKSVVYNNIKKRVGEIVEALKQDENNVWIRPETTGKKSQFAGLKTLLSLSSEFDRVMPCIDFAHMHARTGGLNNSFEEFSSMLSLVEDFFGKTGLKNMHIHISGINYSSKGERNHLVLQDSDFNYVELLKALKNFGACGVVICESPNIEVDAKLLQTTYQSL